jgi:hypothetical protein
MKKLLMILLLALVATPALAKSKVCLGQAEAREYFKHDHLRYRSDHGRKCWFAQGKKLPTRQVARSERKVVPGKDVARIRDGLSRPEQEVGNRATSNQLRGVPPTSASEPVPRQTAEQVFVEIALNRLCGEVNYGLCSFEARWRMIYGK